MNQQVEREELAWKYVDGLCSVAEAQQIEAWMQEDAAFAEEVKFMLGINRLAEQEHVIAAPKGFTGKVMAAVNPKLSLLPFANATFSTRSIIPWALGLAALVVVLALAASGSFSVVGSEYLPAVEAPSDSAQRILVWAVAGAFFFLGLDRFLHYLHIREQRKAMNNV